MTRYQNWLARWRLKRVIKALEWASEHGLRKGVLDFAKSLEATALMTQDQKKDVPVTINVTRRELNEFITYMTRLHSSKLSLWHRARIGLATLTLSADKVLGESAQEFVERELPQARRSKEDERIIKLH